MEGLFEEIDNRAQQKYRQGQENKGRCKLTKNGLNYTKFKKVVLFGLIDDEAPEDWLVIIFNDYLGDLGRMSSFEPPTEWLSKNAELSWSLDIYKNNNS